MSALTKGRWRRFWPYFLMALMVMALIGVWLNVVGWITPSKRAPPTVDVWQTCSSCQSTRYGFDGHWTIYYQGPTFATCQHLWEVGVNSAMDAPVSDGVVVLVRKGNQYGAFVTSPRSSSLEVVSYKWSFRSDGCGRLDASDPQVQSGEATDVPIQFGPFLVAWSAHTITSGWLYYEKTPGDPIAPVDLRICVTDETDIRNVDACDRKWIYKASTVDAGIAGRPTTEDVD